MVHLLYAYIYFLECINTEIYLQRVSNSSLKAQKTTLGPTEDIENGILLISYTQGHDFTTYWGILGVLRLVILSYYFPPPFRPFLDTLVTSTIRILVGDKSTCI